MEVDDHGATTGNGYLTHICQGAYKGRVQRRGYTTITTENETPATATVEFIQLPLAEYVTFDQVSYQALAAGGQITITGKTNAPRLDFALTVDADNIGTLPTYFTITADGVTTQNQAVSGQTFVGDPGATGEIAFTIVITIAANTTISSRYCTLTATGSTGVTGQTNIIQAAGVSYLYVDTMGTTSKTVTFGADGLSDGESSVDVDVLSNDTWEVDVHA
jgi:hypothetical protein